MNAIVQYVHAISPCKRDTSGPYEVEPSNLTSAEAARRWLKKHTRTSVPLKEARHTDCGGWVFFPMRRKGSIWWSVSIRLDVAEVHLQASLCDCRNCRKSYTPPDPPSER
jgi:hypothetical protein